MKLNPFAKAQSVAQRISIGTLSLAVVPLLIAVVVLAVTAYWSDRSRTEQRIYDQLSSLRQVKAQQVQDYFENVERLIQQTAASPVTIESAKSLISSFPTAKSKSTKDISAVREEVKKYYAGPFAQEFAQRTGNSPDQVTSIVDKLSDEAVYAQYLYIASNPRPLGKKGELDSREDGSDYSNFHRQFHQVGRSIVEKFGLYDLFIVDVSSGNLAYSYFKELDYGTNLSDGPFSKTGLGEAFQAGRRASKSDQIYMTDFAPYFPSYNDQAIFMSVPIFDGPKVIAVLIVQMPIDQINRVMTFNKEWEKAGLGKTGEAYLVGSNNAPRSISRQMSTSVDSYLTSLKSLLPEPTVKQIQATQSDIGLRTLESDAIKRALEGETSVGNYNNFGKIPVLGAFSPVKIANQNFGLVVEAAQEELFAPLIKDMIQRAILTILAVAVLAGIAIYLARNLAASVVSPLGQLEDTVKKLQEGDFAARTNLNTPDEFGSLGKQLDKLLDERLQALDTAARENERLNNSVVEIMQAVGMIASTKDLTSKVPVAEDLTGAIADAMNLLNEETGRVLNSVASVSRDVALASEAVRTQSENATTASVREQNEVDLAARELSQAAQALGMIAERAAVCNESAERAVSATQEALEVVNLTVQGVTSSRELIRETEKRIKRLGERSQEIGQVVTIIQTIAERTGILALNASMHAASAGEAGRSFSMVADEVKRLSESARDSTGQIARLISAIQTETKETVVTMNEAITQVVEINRLADAASAGMVRTQQETNALADNVRSISSTSREQAKAGASLMERARIIQETSSETARQLSAQSEEARRLVDYSKVLLDEVSVFKLPQ